MLILLHTSLAFLPSLDISSGGLTSGVSGGSVYLGAGQATGVGSVGGSIELAAGGSASTGGSVSIQSGVGGDTSGNIAIASNLAVLDSTSGNVLINSGSSSGTQGSGNGKYTSVFFSFSSSFLLVYSLAAISNTLPFNKIHTVTISTGETKDAPVGTLTLAGGASERSQGGGVDILGGQSTGAGMGGRILIGKKEPTLGRFISLTATL